MFDVIVKYVSNWTQTFLESFDEEFVRLRQDLRCYHIGHFVLNIRFFVVNPSSEFATEVETSGFTLKMSFYVAVHQIPYRVAPPMEL